MDGMHVEDILFGKSEQLDEFITLYGNKPAVELDKGVLLKIFGLQDRYEQYLGVDDEDQKKEFIIKGFSLIPSSFELHPRKLAIYVNFNLI